MKLIVALTLCVALATLTQAALVARIIGGKTAYTPYIASITVEDKHVCSGVILSDSHVLTTASCIQQHSSIANPVNLAVVVGSVHLPFPGSDPRGVIEVIQHPRYNPYSTLDENNLAVLKLLTPLVFNDWVAPIKLNPNYIGVTRYAALTVCGWGTIRNGRYPEPNNDLQCLKVTAWSHERCRNTLRKLIPVHYGEMCAAGEQWTGLCHWDEGSPLIDTNNELVGIAHWHTKECAIGMPDLYMRISQYIDWIVTAADTAVVAPYKMN